MVGDSQPFLRGRIYCHIGEYSEESVREGEQWDELPSLTVDFVLSRTGRVCFRRLVLDERLQNQVNENGAAAIDYLFKQSYFFLKDMVHRHRHHRHSDDTFIECFVGGEGYKKNIAYQLGKRLIRRPIEKDQNTYQASLGILAYLSSYQRITGETVYTNDSLESVKLSLQSEYTVKSNDAQNKKWLGAAAISLFTYVTAKASYWDDGLALLDNSKDGILQALTILAFFVLSSFVAFKSGVVNPARWYWYQEFMKIPAALQANEKKYKQAIYWIYLILVMVIADIILLSAGQKLGAFFISAFLALVFFVSFVKLKAIAIGRAF